MSVEDRVIAMHARHACARSQLDIGELIINCNKGVVDVTGKVKRPRNTPGCGAIDMKREFKNLINSMRTAHGVKDVYVEKVELVG
jgi:hypothetical protein